MKIKTYKPRRYLNTLKFEEWLTKGMSEDNAEKIGVVFQHVLNAVWNRRKWGQDKDTKIHIDDWDTWSMDVTLSPIILPLLIQLKEQTQGAPFIDDEDVPDDIKKSSAPDLENDWDTDDFHFKRWDWVLDEMIWAFSQTYEDDDQFHTGDHDIVMIPIDEWGKEVPKENAKYFRMDKGPDDTHVHDEVGHKKHTARIANGHRLFGKYYGTLWS